MNTQSEVVRDASSERPAGAERRVPAHTRFVSLAALAGIVTAIGLAAHGTYQAFADSWMAPITLSPDNDMVLQVNVKLSEQELVREKMRTDIERIDLDVVAIDQSIEQLHAIRDNGREALRWTYNSTDAQAAAGFKRTKSLDDQRRLLETMLTRQQTITTDARKNASFGLLSQQDIEREEQTLDSLRLGLAANARDTIDARAMNEQLTTSMKALGDTLENGAKPRANGIMPDIATGQDHAVELNLAAIKLEAEKRALVTQRLQSVDTMKKMDELFKQLRSRPIYRATQGATDAAFVPYSQLDGVKVGSSLVACDWFVFRCHVVGKVAEVLSGEVIAQDPWSNVARGQYVILDLTDKEAAKEKVLRARNGR